MTEKRYNIEYDGNCYKCIVDCEKKVLYTDRKQIVDLLNKLNDENEQLKERLKMNCPEIVWRDLE